MRCQTRWLVTVSRVKLASKFLIMATGATSTNRLGSCDLTHSLNITQTAMAIAAAASSFEPVTLAARTYVEVNFDTDNPADEIENKSARSVVDGATPVSYILDPTNTRRTELGPELCMSVSQAASPEQPGMSMPL